MQTKIETITPKYAEQVLETSNPVNRSLSQQAVEAYALDMRQGRWTLTHQGLAFDENDNMIDGQHRLWAVVLYGKPVDFMVTRGIPVQVNQGGVILKPMDTIDGGRQRTTGQRFSLSHGIMNGNQVAASIRVIIMIACGTNNIGRLSTGSSLAVYNVYGKNVEAILNGSLVKKRGSHIVGPLAMYHHSEPEKAILFRDQINMVANLSVPARCYLRHLEVGHFDNKQSAWRSVKMLASALFAFHNGEEDMKKLVEAESGMKFLQELDPPSIRKAQSESFGTKGLLIKARRKDVL